MTPSLRRAQFDDASALPAVERSAAILFRNDPELAWLADAPVTSVEQHLRAIESAQVWVAEMANGSIVGFLSAHAVDTELHIQEVSVSSAFQGQGLGRRLLQTALEYARHSGLTALTLTTFRTLPWNEPFYQRFGFESLAFSDLDHRLQAVLEAEITHGLPGARRCAMRYCIKP
ncbi:amino-acid N-acetyltransferase [Pseudomonas sp. FW306-02-F02-AA]|uniref:GNAT family acetyltransferase n=1 Tax=Pseudomonas fluorescens TaxID=294 RepID=A0A0N7H0W4_PSEFL|nr:MULTISPECIES: GNAT family N-acetyltransferase [Pseudomonas]ALI04268.1 GNAT family acetyltransferase [Pseudomonas fluorescens]PMZ02469.1 amino-acid N-acetyltransferase [Pseudomonas sp. FW306-02-F02-AB]PMZ10074.1 amino-acid N-acetyltransferase [Pseudomonas sp. FW306-02-H06C]PMZ14212.1 amino-acid N-acetyltransferase [Pseudomonas sp. FW306-02-F02-AA]PMZ20374.1 amino-acid N-acetyltransferase [Pseudomonas sp. FW306-02-F08-AA]